MSDFLRTHKVEKSALVTRCVVLKLVLPVLIILAPKIG